MCPLLISCLVHPMQFSYTEKHAESSACIWDKLVQALFFWNRNIRQETKLVNKPVHHQESIVCNNFTRLKLINAGNPAKIVAWWNYVDQIWNVLQEELLLSRMVCIFETPIWEGKNEIQQTGILQGVLKTGEKPKRYQFIVSNRQWSGILGKPNKIPVPSFKNISWCINAQSY